MNFISSEPGGIFYTVNLYIDHTAAVLFLLHFFTT